MIRDQENRFMNVNFAINRLIILNTLKEKIKMSKYTIEYIKKNNLIIFEAIAGSKAYGTNIETSDYKIELSNIVSKVEYAKLGVKITNTGTDYLMFNKGESEFVYKSGKYTDKEKYTYMCSCDIEN